MSAFRFGFIDLSWGFEGGSFVSFGNLELDGGTKEGPPPRESFCPHQPHYFAGYFFPLWPFLQSTLSRV